MTSSSSVSKKLQEAKSRLAQYQNAIGSYNGPSRGLENLESQRDECKDSISRLEKEYADAKKQE